MTRPVWWSLTSSSEPALTLPHAYVIKRNLQNCGSSKITVTIMPVFSRGSESQKQPTVFLVRANDLPTRTLIQTRQGAPDGPNNRYQINQRCLYERRLPGEAYMTAHVERLQPGIYDDSINMSKSVAQTPKPASKPTAPPPAKPAVSKISRAQYFGKPPIRNSTLLLLMLA